MKKNWILILNLLLLVGVIYLKFFNSVTSKLIAEVNQLQSVLAFIIFYITIHFLSNTAKYFYSKKNKIPKNKKNNVHFGIENIANFTISIGILLMLLSIFGINPTELITSLTIVAAAIALLTKEYIVDFLSGIYLSFSNTFEINDFVKINNQKGKIVEISMLKVHLLNDDDDIVIIPNSKVHYGEIINYTKKDIRLMTIDFQIALKNINNIEQLEKEIIISLQSFKEFIDPKSYKLKVVEMKMDYLDLKFQYTLKKIDMDLQQKIRKRTIREVFNFISSVNRTPTAE
ncbi:mechanosensitive ion channel domain-containing protein [Lutibacter sp.]|uniref:mechanosensitive ion channel family protein n=1 Tax=Lutibacter sp. TaxID=1925666 RepID=UPI001A28978D|nr:mechanosensitive ion channel domain-containing protein [Lutibacter sp.]MBI9041928.1 mechanosensitive ion channel [Lutibacter sp.]